jgi:hypothetical protein
VLHRWCGLAFSDWRGRSARRVTIAAGVAVVLVTVALWPTTRLIAVNYSVSHETLPLWRKVSEFIERDRQLAAISRDVLGHIQTDEAKAQAALAWTRSQIAFAPHDKPVIDDHISSVIARRYGQADQQADVFVTLLSYAGVRAYWEPIGRSPRVLPLSYVRLDDHWRVFDVTNGIVFRTGSGAIATPLDIARDPQIVARAAGDAGIETIDDYLWYFNGYQPRPAPAVSRAELQMPGRRVWFELQRAAGRAPAHAQE